MYNTFVPKKQPKPQPDQYEDTAQPWDQLPKETDQAFTAFLTYRRIGIGRTFGKVAEKLYGQNASKHIYQIEEWADLHNWEKRAHEYDGFIRQHENEIIDRHVRDARMKMAEHFDTITDESINIALGKKKANKDQVKMIEGLYDRGGMPKQKNAENTTNIMNNIQVTSPELPDDIKDQYEAEEAQFEEIEDEADNLIPDHLKQKRFLGGGDNE